MDVREPARIFFLVNQDIFGLPGPEAMAPDLHRTVIVVELDVKERALIRAPHHRAVGFLDDIVEVFFGRPVAHADREIFRALDVGAPRLKSVIGRMPGTAEPEIAWAFAQLPR